mgnify:CR=1 FL=1
MDQGWSFFSASERLLSWRPIGTLDQHKIVELFEFLADTESNGGPRIPDKYVDLTDIDGIAITFEALRRSVDRQRMAVETALRRPVKTAFYVDNPVTSGVVRLLQALLESPLIDLRLFTSKTEAFAWLEVDPEVLVE